MVNRQWVGKIMERDSHVRIIQSNIVGAIGAFIGTIPLPLLPWKSTGPTLHLAAHPRIRSIYTHDSLYIHNTSKRLNTHRESY